MNSPFGPPIDLADLPGLGWTQTPSRRPAFLGRVSTKDNQNPASSIPRQVALAAERLKPGEDFVGHYWDVESGMLPPDLRGLGSHAMYEALAVSTPRDGGLQDLMERGPHLGITHVVAERSDRVARAMLTNLTVEHVLERAGIEVVYANEPVGGSRSGQLRARRSGQVDAEVYRENMLEMSMGGQFQHAYQGWNHGYAPYPYVTVIDEAAPLRERERFGANRPKRKLAPHPDPRRFTTARELCRLRREEHLKTSDIIAILASNPTRYPLKTHWTHDLVNGLLANPKLTGYQVYNRRATRTGHKGMSRRNPPSQWVWSPRPVHEAVVTVEEWKTAQEVTASMRTCSDDVGALSRIRAEARRHGFTVTAVDSSDSHTRYRIGPRLMVLPKPIPDTIVQQIIEDMDRSA